MAKPNMLTFPVKLYRLRCIACGYCVSLAPEIWTLSKADGKVAFIDNGDETKSEVNVFIDRDFLHLVKQTEAICQVRAIRVM